MILGVNLTNKKSGYRVTIGTLHKKETIPNTTVPEGPKYRRKEPKAEVKRPHVIHLKSPLYHLVEKCKNTLIFI